MGPNLKTQAQNVIWSQKQARKSQKIRIDFKIVYD